MNPYYMRMKTREQQALIQEVLVMIEKAVQGEREDELFYDYLIENAPTDEEKNIIMSIRDDEKRHNHNFRQIYSDFTGQKIPPATEAEEFQYPESYLMGLKKALFGEMTAVKRYRDIRKFMPSRYYRDILFDIITDELRHGNFYNYLISLNS